MFLLNWLLSVISFLDDFLNWFSHISFWYFSSLWDMLSLILLLSFWSHISFYVFASLLRHFKKFDCILVGAMYALNYLISCWIMFSLNWLLSSWCHISLGLFLVIDDSFSLYLCSISLQFFCFLGESYYL